MPLHLKVGGGDLPLITELALLIRCAQCFPHIDFTWVGHPGIFTAAQVYLVAHFFFNYYYYPLTLFFVIFLSALENETIRDRLTSGKSPLALCVS